MTRSVALAEIPGGIQVRTAPVTDLAALAADVRVYAVSLGLLDAVRGKVPSGHNFDEGNLRRTDAVVLVGSAAAGRLGLRTGSTGEAIFIGDAPLAVMGVFESTSVAPELASAVLVSSGFAEAAADRRRARRARRATGRLVRGGEGHTGRTDRRADRRARRRRMRRQLRDHQATGGGPAACT